MVEKTIKLATGLYDNSTLMLTENDSLHIRIIGKTYPNASYYFKGKNGNREFNLKFQDNLIEINTKDLNIGELKAKVLLMIEDKIITEFKVENLIIQELDGQIKVLPQFEMYKKQFNTLIENQNLLIQGIRKNQLELAKKYEKIEEFAKEIEQLKKLVYVMCNIGGNENE